GQTTVTTYSPAAAPCCIPVVRVKLPSAATTADGRCAVIGSPSLGWKVTTAPSAPLPSARTLPWTRFSPPLEQPSAAQAREAASKKDQRRQAGGAPMVRSGER